jgi:hypothetical protein
MEHVAQVCAARLTAPILCYLAERGFPESFVHQRRISYGSSPKFADVRFREVTGAQDRALSSIFWQA